MRTLEPAQPSRDAEPAADHERPLPSSLAAQGALTISRLLTLETGSYHAPSPGSAFTRFVFDATTQRFYVQLAHGAEVRGRYAVEPRPTEWILRLHTDLGFDNSLRLQIGPARIRVGAVGDTVLFELVKTGSFTGGLPEERHRR